MRVGVRPGLYPDSLIQMVSNVNLLVVDGTASQPASGLPAPSNDLRAPSGSPANGAASKRETDAIDRGFEGVPGCPDKVANCIAEMRQAFRNEWCDCGYENND